MGVMAEIVNKVVKKSADDAADHPIIVESPEGVK